MTLLRRDLTVPIDDTDSNVAYTGSWKTLAGSTRQWNGVVHSTTQFGATVSFRFHGSQFTLYDTIPAGSGTISVDVSIDGGIPTRVTRTSGSQDVYSDRLFVSNTMSEAMHTVVVTNRGQSVSGPPFQFDKVDIHSDIMPGPTIASPPSPPAITVVNVVAQSSTAPQVQSLSVSSSRVSDTASDLVSLSSSTMYSMGGSTSAVFATGSTSASGLASVLLTTNIHGYTITITPTFKTVGGETIASYPTSVGGSGALRPTSDLKSTSTPTMIASILGGITILLLLLFIIFYFRRRRTPHRHVILGDKYVSTETTPKGMRSRKLTLTPTPFRLDQSDATRVLTPPTEKRPSSRSPVSQSSFPISENLFHRTAHTGPSSAQANHADAPQAGQCSSPANRSTIAQSSSSGILLHRHSASISSPIGSNFLDAPPAYQQLSETKVADTCQVEVIKLYTNSLTGHRVGGSIVPNVIT